MWRRRRRKLTLASVSNWTSSRSSERTPVLGDAEALDFLLFERGGRKGGGGGGGEEGKSY
jgi:hypothetical protein